MYRADLAKISDMRSATGYAKVYTLLEMRWLGGGKYWRSHAKIIYYPGKNWGLRA
jgi:hypothetical protein